MIDLIARVKALIAKAAHSETPENEARTCAMQACKLIEREKLDIVRSGRIPLYEVDHGNSEDWDDVIMGDKK